MDAVVIYSPASDITAKAVLRLTDSGRQTSISWQRSRAAERSQLSGEADELFLHQSRALNRREKRTPERKQAYLKTVSHLGCDLLVVDMRSRKRSLGNSGFSSPLKYSFRTPATELMSWSLWSSTRGSSPVHMSHVQLSVTAHMAIHSAFMLRWSDAFLHLQKMACTSINMWHVGSLCALTFAVGQAVSPGVDKCSLKSIKRRRQGTNLFQMHF